ncbi:lysosomal proton-coupled steroid conjugate and bile acid symporter SLC46A3 [Arctopsyche grandis]|uniref:lysosomal proton-coupled steroid conjugate and bile acid symporter SLC46A3 n=1 Tax=Arctopsyche grandis TaxID=121162 RepID=UPI00406D777C
MKCGAFLKWLSLISVEPIMFLYMMAFTITSVVEQAFFINKACTVNHGHGSEICDNLSNSTNAAINNQVQKTISTFIQWNNIAGHVVPIILALFLGAWSDKRGRKGILIAGLVGKLWYSVFIIIIASQKTWPLEYVIYIATIPSALTGADVAIFAAAFSYISDITTSINRTMRVAILDVCYLSTFPTGVALGNYLFHQVFNKSYSDLFAINASFLFIAIIYSAINLKWKTTEKHQSMSEAGVHNFFADFFDKNHAVSSFRALTKERPHHRRAYLLIMMISMALYTFQRDEKPMLFLYTIKVFGWDANIYSNFKTFQSTAYVIMMLIAMPLMSRVLNWRDTIIVMIGSVSHAGGRFFFAFAKQSWFFYIGAVVASLGPCVAPVIRSMTSKTVPLEERGKVFALLSVCDNAVALFSSILYSQLYNATLDTEYPNAIFFLTIASQFTVLLLISCVHISLGSEPMEKYSDETVNVRSELIEGES